MPTLTIFAGINGAGKSTLYSFQKGINSDEFGTRVCPDEFLEEAHGDWKCYADVYDSGMVALKTISRCLEEKKSFNWETTLLTRFSIKNIKKAKELGYNVNLNFIGVEDVEQSLARIKHRVENGGHGVEEELVRARHRHQFNNLGEVLTLVDNAILYENKERIKIVGACYAGTLEIYDSSSILAKSTLDSFEKAKENMQNANDYEKFIN